MALLATLSTTAVAATTKTQSEDFDAIGKQARAGILPKGVEIMTFTEGNRKVTAAVKIDTAHTRFTLGYAIFRRDRPEEKFDKKALRETAVKRLFKKPIVVTSPPLESTQRKNEMTTAFIERAAREAKKRAVEWTAAFGALAQTQLETFPSSVFQHPKESDAAFVARKTAATTAFIATQRLPVIATTAAEVDALRVEKQRIINLRRKYVREAIVACPYNLSNKQQQQLQGGGGSEVDQPLGTASDFIGRLLGMSIGNGAVLQQQDGHRIGDRSGSWRHAHPHHPPQHQAAATGSADDDDSDVDEE
jgi:hypothetical protein